MSEQDDKIREGLGLEAPPEDAPSEAPPADTPPEKPPEAPDNDTPPDDASPEALPEDAPPEPFTEEQWREKQEEKAKAHGWKPLDEFIESGGDPDDWVTPEVFNVKGDFIGQLRQKDRDREREIEERLQGVRKLYEGRLKELSTARDEAIELGDKDKVHDLDKQMADIQLHMTPAQQQADQKAFEETCNTWNAQNPWINENTPKAAYARQVFNQHVASGVPVEEVLKAVDAAVSKEFPTKAPAKQSTPALGERGRGARGFRQGAPKTPTMADLTQEEAKLWADVPDWWGNDETKFLKAVADARKAEEKAND